MERKNILCTSFALSIFFCVYLQVGLCHTSSSFFIPKILFKILVISPWNIFFLWHLSLLFTSILIAICELKRNENAFSKEEKQNILYIYLKMGVGRSMLFIQRRKGVGPRLVGADWLGLIMLMCHGRVLGASTMHITQPEHLLGLSFCPLSLRIIFFFFFWQLFTSECLK